MQDNTLVVYIKYLNQLLQDIFRFICHLPFYIYLFITTFSKSLVKHVFRKSKSLRNETILITGAASGLGQHVVWKLAKKFPTARYILWDLNEKGLQQTKEKCMYFGASKVYIYQVDLSKRKEVAKASAQVREQIGTVTVLFNNAGIARNALFLNSDLANHELEFKINTLSYMWTIWEFLPEMIKQGKGHLVSTCSGTGFFRLYGGSGYAASKYGLRGFLETLKLEMRKHPEKPDITISTIYPGFTKTPMVDSNVTLEPKWSAAKLMEPEYVAEKIVDGILKEKEDIMIPWSLHLLDVFYRIFPSEFVDAIENHLFDIKLKSPLLDEGNTRKTNSKEISGQRLITRGAQ